MSHCSICYEDNLKEYEFVKAGCCSNEMCRECVLNIFECPVCKKDFPWVSKNFETMKKAMEAEHQRDKLNVARELWMSMLENDVLKKDNEEFIQLTYRNVRKMNEMRGLIEEQENQIEHLINSITKSHKEKQLMKDLVDVSDRLNLI